eukprot:CAMPEP_0184309340 /NCGR_PEP_ID=MMETSP1049-20130417/17532_1 /TAXON_ID=77928 /ORGANISM="Proteomonas sulcata, Strain CCMP704" /LENGTH=446 /DNA_ID=CAMNT_0026622215 /DNA_START=352 /DNA_END=1693 /DNA_ORIENTATION=-
MPSFSVAVNVFWRDLAPQHYNPKDIYGNKDLPALEQALVAAQKATALLAALPQPYRGFYGARVAQELRQQTSFPAPEPSRGPGEGKVVVITGAGGGLGFEIASLLATEGAIVILACRNIRKLKEKVSWLRGLSCNERIWLEEVDVASEDSIHKLALGIQVQFRRVDVLINNAVLSPQQRQLSEEGLEMQFAVNVMGYHRMINYFHPLLTTPGGRIVNLASEFAGKLDLEDLMFEKRQYKAVEAYMQAKQANRMLSWGWAERLSALGICVNACHPGVVAGTQLAESLGLKSGSSSAKEGAERAVALATDLKYQGATGKFFVEGEEKQCKWQGTEGVQHLMTKLDSLTDRPVRPKKATDPVDLEVAECKTCPWADQTGINACAMVLNGSATLKGQGAKDIRVLGASGYTTKNTSASATFRRWGLMCLIPIEYLPGNAGVAILKAICPL